MQRFCGADLCALVAEDALRSVFPFTRFFVDLRVDGADAQALAAVNALILITVDAQKRKKLIGLRNTVMGHRYLQNARLSLNANARAIPAM